MHTMWLKGMKYMKHEIWVFLTPYNTLIIDMLVPIYDTQNSSTEKLFGNEMNLKTSNLLWTEVCIFPDHWYNLKVPVKISKQSV